ncbi:hypothetical protein QWZ16_23685 [Vibrio ostreicida]|uniref:DUF3265 domain-containing protein n=1 Tax=Vibrio ostreicida TaxID=526588 RepID=A0ABT8C003_9VIBR|nr:hypothetical protein [Vibrio ostreicida]MDN3611273.1 hypothetical protein [Vibrio ostreicida]MDN3612603.1 hypothetical protein [Vibrio ostreicida]
MSQHSRECSVVNEMRRMIGSSAFFMVSQPFKWRAVVCQWLRVSR